MTIKPPSFVRTREQKKYFRDVLGKLNENKVPLQSHDMFALGTLAVNLALIDECIIDISKNGLMLEVQGDRSVVSKVNPAVALQKEAQMAVRFYFKEFGMTANSRASSFVVNPTENKGSKIDKFIR